MSSNIVNVLRVDASPRGDASISRSVADRIIDGLDGPVDVVVRDLAETAPGHFDADWVAANFTPAEDRTPEQIERLAASDALVAEVQAADVLVISAPVYNFGIPARLKSWIDMVVRPGVTFRYGESGPIGLLDGKRAVVAVASGGTAVGSPLDFHTPYLRHVLGFVGIRDVSFVTEADLQNGKA